MIEEAHALFIIRSKVIRIREIDLYVSNDTVSTSIQN
jgi:hypothetical protein